MNLIWPVDEPHRPARRPHTRQREVLRHAASAVGLDRPVNHLERHVGHVDFGLGNLHKCVLGVDLVDLGRSVEYDEAGGVDLDPAVRDALEGCALAAECLAEGRPVRIVCTRDEILECFLCLYIEIAPECQL